MGPQKASGQSVSGRSILLNNCVGTTTSKILQIQNSLTIAGTRSVTAELFKQDLLGTAPEKDVITVICLSQLPDERADR
ncbi:MAG: hypothetical protein ABIU63_19030 [Chitinophagaceae bacterium]